MMAKWDEEEENIDVPPNTVSLHARASFETDILVNVEDRQRKESTLILNLLLFQCPYAVTAAAPLLLIS